MTGRRIDALKDLAVSSSGILAILVLWELATGVFHWFVWIVLPPPTDVFMTMVEMLLSGDLFINIGYTLLRVLGGFALAALVALPLGIAMGWIPLVSRIMDPVVEVFRPIPPTAWIGLAILWFGLGWNSSLFLVFIGAFFPIILNTIYGVRSVEKRLVEVAITFRARDLEVLKSVVLPAAAPTIFTGLRVGMGIGWMCVVAAEMIAVKFGLGNMILESSNFAQTDRVIVGMVTIGLMGLAINYLFVVAGKRLFSWQESFDNTSG